MHLRICLLSLILEFASLENVTDKVPEQLNTTENSLNIKHFSKVPVQLNTTENSLNIKNISEATPIMLHP